MLFDDDNDDELLQLLFMLFGVECCFGSCIIIYYQKKIVLCIYVDNAVSITLDSETKNVELYITKKKDLLIELIKHKELSLSD